ncbi:tyrosine-type recombinase/integrase [Pedobacter flavus]|uniref:Site-specific integrase n=1 Tax=Pedobacter flavus TaxID=3113906 RepID=A0ABU7GZ49_9SPHI|nr:site-specific integrase [Pedobacter sp. VNH31]MEE1884360.1 site-specific integrase [Pedobacter sp. VNH31]
MFTQPKIHLPKSANDRVYIEFYYNGKRYREYNGNRLNISINPNQTNVLKDKKRLLNVLLYEFTKALKAGWNPTSRDKIPSLKNALQEVIEEKLNSNLTVLYKRNLKSVHKMFINHLTSDELKGITDHLSLRSIETFLNQFQSSERNYINRRRCLGTLFNEIVRKGYASKNLVKSTKSAKAKASLHVPYTRDELKNILSFLESYSDNLYLCCLLTYGCLLRPHHEIRLLKSKNIVNNVSQIQLSGSENKSKKNRIVPIPAFIQNILRERISRANDSNANIFTMSTNAYNPGYFNVLWNKAKPMMKKNKLLRDNQTIYSFRHTAALDIYRKTKDLHILQQLLGHSDMIVTLKYLRGLGVSTNDELRSVMPDL